jgi:DNA-binding transcriptional ArsR family regulator
MGKTNYVSNKNKQLSSLFGNSIRSKIVTILLGGKEIKSFEINKKVNLFGEEYGISIIQEHITDLKNNGFITQRREGRQMYYRINSSGNIFLRNFCNLMKAPNEKKSDSDIKMRKTTKEWIKEVESAISLITKNKSGVKFTTIEIREKVNIESQRLSQILLRIAQKGDVARVEGEDGKPIRGLYFVKVKLN